MLTVLITAVAVAMDAVAVSIASGLSATQTRVRDALKVALFFGGFQSLMPLAGYALGAQFAEQLAPFDHWIAFVLLGGLGFKMLRESREAGDPEKPKMPSPYRTHNLVVLGIATSLDAFSVGISFSLLDYDLFTTTASIGIVTFALCLPAVLIGAHISARSGAALAQRAEVLGGLALIAIGANILYQHLSQGI